MGIFQPEPEPSPRRRRYRPRRGAVPQWCDTPCQDIRNRADASWVCGRELRRLNEAVYQVLGIFPAGLVMLCKTVEILFLSEEILIELREQFHEIMVHIGTAQTLVLCLGRQTVESVTEFMQERLNLVGIEKHRVAACRFREIADNRNQRYRLVTLVIFCLGTEFSHPGTRTLAGTIEENRHKGYREAFRYPRTHRRLTSG